jgi:hypothetical protein
MVQPVTPNNPPKNVNPAPPVPVDHPAPKLQNSEFDHVVDQAAGQAPAQAARVQTTVKAQIAPQAPAPPPEDLPPARVDTRA